MDIAAIALDRADQTVGAGPAADRAGQRAAGDKAARVGGGATHEARHDRAAAAAAERAGQRAPGKVERVVAGSAHEVLDAAEAADDEGHRPGVGGSDGPR